MKNINLRVIKAVASPSFASLYKETDLPGINEYHTSKKQPLSLLQILSHIYSGRFEKKKDPSQPFTHQLLHPFVIGLPCIIAALFRLKMGESLAIF